MTNFEIGDVVDVPFPFVDREIRKRRPAVVIGVPVADGDVHVVVLAMVTSARRSRWESDVELVGWSRAGLLAPSVVRMKIFTLDQGLILGRRGRLDEADRRRVFGTLRQTCGMDT